MSVGDDDQPRKPTLGHDATRPVGPGNPPRHSQFKAGESGNPKGRRKRAPTVEEEAAEIAAETVPVNDRGRRTRARRQTVMLQSLAAKAMRGDTKAFITFQGFVSRYRKSADASPGTSKLTAEELAIIAEFGAALNGQEGKPLDEKLQASAFADNADGGPHGSE